jgi:hypothetical protein
LRNRTIKWVLALGNLMSMASCDHGAAEGNQDSYMGWRKAVGISESPGR